MPSSFRAVWRGAQLANLAGYASHSSKACLGLPVRMGLSEGSVLVIESTLA